MEISVRDEILKKLEIKDELKTSILYKKIPQKRIEEADLLSRFKDMLSLLTGQVFLTESRGEALEKLNEILKNEEISKIIVTNEDFIESLNLKEWGKSVNIDVRNKDDYSDREEFKADIFDSINAGITSADYAISESGTLLSVFGEKNPRLVSLAPKVHIAIVPFDRLVPFYEDAVLKAMKDNKPSQLALITGPSMSADIMATSFTGMHGPERVYVIFIK